MCILPIGHQSITERHDIDGMMLNEFGIRNSKDESITVVDEEGKEYIKDGSWIYLILTSIPIQVVDSQDRLNDIKKLILNDLQKS